MLLALSSGALAHEDHDPETAVVLAPGYEKLSYEAPVPGSYQLPALGSAGNGTLIDADGNAHELHALIENKIALVSFIYTRCNDVNGCPLASFVLAETLKRLQSEPAIAQHTRALSISFDPEHDDPEVMAEYGKRYNRNNGDWLFLTPGTQARLDPLLEAYGQSINREVDENGRTLSTISHILRVYLIDTDKRIRNVYSVSFLHADSVLADIKTVLLDSGSEHGTTGRLGALQGAGDVRAGYEDDDWVSRAAALESRQGVPANLLALAREPQLGLPTPKQLGLDQISAKQVKLGRKLFFDRRLSHNGTLSCAMCHIPEQGFASNELSMAVGIEGRSGRRNAPSLYNVAMMQRLFHDGRESSLENQVWSPLLAHNEMGNPAIGTVLHRLRTLPDYAGRFEAAFSGQGPNMLTVGQALAAYERTLIAGASAFDRYYYGGDVTAMSDAAHRGLRLFTGKAGCVSCHHISRDSASFTDHELHNTGIGYANTMLQTSEQGAQVQLAPGTFVAVDPKVLAEAGEDRPNDLGLYEITEDPADRWKYRTPTLRNVALTAPYMHNGALATLKDVVDFYDRGGVPHDALDPLIRPLQLNRAERDDLVAFLQALTGANIDALVADAFAAPVGDPE